MASLIYRALRKATFTNSVAYFQPIFDHVVSGGTRDVFRGNAACPVHAYLFVGSAAEAVHTSGLEAHAYRHHDTSVPVTPFFLMHISANRSSPMGPCLPCSSPTFHSFTVSLSHVSMFAARILNAVFEITSRFPKKPYSH